MSTEVEVGELTLNTTTGNQSVTGLTFQPKFVLFKCIPMSGDGTNGGDESSFGIAISSAAQRSIMWSSLPWVSASQANKGWSSNRCFWCGQANSNTNLRYAAEFVSQNSNGFTINITTAPGSGYKVLWMAVGGSDITAELGDFILNDSAGDQAVTGLLNKPDFLMFFGVLGTASSNAISDDGLSAFLGYTSGVNNQVCSAWTEADAVTTTEAKRYQRTNYAIAIAHYIPSTIDTLAKLKSFDANGFTLTKDDPPAFNRRVNYLAVKGGGWFVSSFLSRTSTGTIDTTVSGCTPKAVLASSVLQPASSTLNNNRMFAFGVARSSTKRGCKGSNSETGVTSVNSFNFSHSDAVIAGYSPYYSKEISIDLTSFLTNGIQFNQTLVNTAEQKEILYLAIGNSLVAVQPNSIGSGAAFGSPTVICGNVNIAVTTIFSFEAVGSPGFIQNLIINASGIETAEQIGSAALAYILKNIGDILSAEAFGFLLLSRGAVSIQVEGVESAESFGAPTLTVGGTSVLANSITSDETFGDVQLNLNISLLGIESSETFGQAIIAAQGVSVVPTAVESEELFGDVSVIAGNVNILLNSIVNTVAVGEVIVRAGNVNVSASSVESAEEIGSATILPQSAFITSESILSAEEMGAASISVGYVDLDPLGILSAEQIGSPYVTVAGVQLSPYSIETAECFGDASVIAASVSISVSSINGNESFGNVLLTVGPIEITAESIETQEGFGSLEIGGEISVLSISSEECLGLISISTGNISVSPSSIQPNEAFGLSIVRNVLVLVMSGLITEEGFGFPFIVSVVRNTLSKMMENDLQDVFFNTEEFGETVTYLYKDGTVLPLPVIFDEESVMVDPETGAAVLSAQPMMQAQSSDFRVRPDKGDKVLRRGVRYQIITHDPDGTGVTVFRLHQERTV